MLSVCHIISGDLWAGAEVMTYNLLKGLRIYSDLKCSAILLNEGKLTDLIRELNIPVYVFEENKMTFPQILLGMQKVFKHQSPHVVHSHRYKENMLAYLASKTKKNIKLIATQHGMPEHDMKKSGIKQRIVTSLNFAILSKAFHRVIAVSKDIQNIFVEQYRFPKNKVAVVHNGIMIPEYLLAKQERKAFVIGSAGRLSPVKDYPFMVEVAKEILKETKEIRFDLAGDGPELNKIQLHIQKYNLEKFFFLRGPVSDMDAFYQGLDLYLNTSVHEGIPMSVLEAMVRGIPVIAPKVGGFEEIIEDGIQGFIVENREPKDFAERCIAVYKNNSMRRQMGSAAREKIVQNLSMQNMAEQYHEIYVNV